MVKLFCGGFGLEFESMCCCGLYLSDIRIICSFNSKSSVTTKLQSRSGMLFKAKRCRELSQEEDIIFPEGKTGHEAEEAKILFTGERQFDRDSRNCHLTITQAHCDKLTTYS